MNALMSSRPRRGSCSEYLSSMSGAAISSMTGKIDLLTPEFGKPAADDGLVVHRTGVNPQTRCATAESARSARRRDPFQRPRKTQHRPAFRSEHAAHKNDRAPGADDFTGALDQLALVHRVDELGRE